MGKSFWHMHHYCWALLNMRRADLVARNSQERRGLRGEAVGDIEYVIKNSPRNFVLLPEVLTTLGGVHILMGTAGAAMDAFQQARDIKPDYWPAYSDWADFLIRSGQKVQAKQLVKLGLEYAPNSKVLQDQFRLLGGDPTEVVPKTKLQVPSATEAAPAAGSPLASGGTSSHEEQKKN
jgi:tetratricopeptide (TPR) repeat protein